MAERAAPVEPPEEFLAPVAERRVRRAIVAGGRVPAGFERHRPVAVDDVVVEPQVQLRQAGVCGYDGDRGTLEARDAEAGDRELKTQLLAPPDLVAPRDRGLAELARGSDELRPCARGVVEDL